MIFSEKRVIFQERGPDLLNLDDLGEIHGELEDVSSEDKLFSEAFSQDDELDNIQELRERREYLNLIRDPNTSREGLRDIAYRSLDVEVNLALLANHQVDDDLKNYIFEEIILPTYNYDYSLAFLDITNPEVRRFIANHYEIRFDPAEFIFETMPRENVSNYLDDPSLVFASSIPARIFINDEIANEELIDAVILISRYLFTLNIPYSDENAQTAWETLKSIRENQEIRNIELFAHRNVILLSHNETLPEDADSSLDFDNPESRSEILTGPRFGREATIAGLERQNPSSFEHLRLAGGNRS